MKESLHTKSCYDNEGCVNGLTPLLRPLTLVHATGVKSATCNVICLDVLLRYNALTITCMVCYRINQEKKYFCLISHGMLLICSPLALCVGDGIPSKKETRKDSEDRRG